MTNFAANNTNASAGNIKICEITPRNGSPTELNAVVTNLSYYENLLAATALSELVLKATKEIWSIALLVIDAV